MTREGRGERARKWLHLLPGLAAFAVRDLGYAGSIALTAGLLAFNFWCLPRLGGRRLWRREEWSRGESVAMLFYPGALLLLALATPRHPEVLAGAWGMLAFGDAAATLVGRRWGRRTLPWNRGKSWLGVGAFMATSWLALVVLVGWTCGQVYPWVSLSVVALVAAAAGALLESLPWRMDDNLSVTLGGGAVLYLALTASESAALGHATAKGAGAIVLLIVGVGAVSLGALVLRALGRLGALAAWGVGLGVGWGTGWPGLALLGLFVIAGTVATGWRRRCQGRGDGWRPRRARNVLANGAVAAGCGLLAFWEPDGLGVIAMAAALAAALADTVGGEIGRTRAGTTWRLPSFDRVAPGVDGGISVVGTVTTLAAASMMAVVAEALGVIDGRAAVLVAVAGSIGALLDSLLGGTLERRGHLDNEGVNFLSTLAAAWIAGLGIGV